MRISDWSSDGCSSDLPHPPEAEPQRERGCETESHSVHPGLASQYPCQPKRGEEHRQRQYTPEAAHPRARLGQLSPQRRKEANEEEGQGEPQAQPNEHGQRRQGRQNQCRPERRAHERPGRSEEHTSELQSLMRISYAVFCLKKKKKPNTTH